MDKGERAFGVNTVFGILKVAVIGEVLKMFVVY